MPVDGPRGQRSGLTFMATGSTTSSSTISDISIYCGFAEARFGSNGATDGDAEVELGAVNQSPASGRRTWDSNLSDGLAVGPLIVQFTAEAGGGSNGLKWSVAGANPSPLQYSGVTYGNITKVRIRAAVQTTAMVQWTQVQVRFYKNGRLNESYVASSAGPAVNTSNSTAPVTAEQILDVVPDLSGNTKVIVSAYIEFASPQGVYPGVNDLFAQVFIETQSCSSQ